jgi:AAA family ATPase
LIPGTELASLDIPINHEAPEEKSSAWLVINEDDVIAAMQDVRPTAMREVFLETPKVRWTDIGGQHALKRHLQKMVERPLKVLFTIVQSKDVTLTYYSFLKGCEDLM